MEDSSNKNNNFSSLLGPSESAAPQNYQNTFTELDAIQEIPTPYQHNDKYPVGSRTTKPPRATKIQSMTRSNVAVGGHSSSNFGNLALVGHKKKNRASKQLLPSLSGHVTGFSTASSRKAKSVARGNHTQYTTNSQNLNIIDKYQSIDEQIDAIVRKNNNRSAIDLQNFKNQ